MMETRQSNTGRNLLLGCLGVILLVIVVGIIAGIYVARNARQWVGDGMHTAGVAMIKDSNLPDDQKERIILQIDELHQGFLAGVITFEQLGQVFAEIAESPLLPMGLVWAMDAKYVEPSGLDDQAKADARLQLQRFARGVYEEQLNETDVDEVIEPYSTVAPDGSRELKEQLTDEELNALIADVKQRADSAGISNEPFDVDIAAEVEKAIDEALAQ
jgi:hypothetical protein